FAEVAPSPCPQCGAPARLGREFCSVCGAALVPGPQPSPARSDTGQGVEVERQGESVRLLAEGAGGLHPRLGGAADGPLAAPLEALDARGAWPSALPPLARRQTVDGRLWVEAAHEPGLVSLPEWWRRQRGQAGADDRLRDVLADVLAGLAALHEHG